MEDQIEDKNIIVKALLRRGLAYEHLEKYTLAKTDMTKVKEMQPGSQ